MQQTGIEERYKLLQIENSQLKERVAILEERLLILGKEQLNKEWSPPVEFQLTIKEARMLGSLYTSKDVVTKENFLTALYHDRYDDELPEIKIIDVFVCKLRRKVKPYGIEIDTVWGRGYRMSAEGRRILDTWGQEVQDGEIGS